MSAWRRNRTANMVSVDRYIDEQHAIADEKLEASRALTEFVTELRGGRQPSLAWTVRWAPDGRLDRIWTATNDPDAMRVILDDKKIGTIVHPENALGMRLSPAANAGLKIVTATLFDVLLAPLIPTRIQPPPLAPYLFPHAFDEAERDRHMNVARIRAAWRGELPTLQELLKRFKIGVYVEESR